MEGYELFKSEETTEMQYSNQRKKPMILCVTSLLVLEVYRSLCLDLSFGFLCGSGFAVVWVDMSFFVMDNNFFTVDNHFLICIPIKQFSSQCMVHTFHARQWQDQSKKTAYPPQIWITTKKNCVSAQKKPSFQPR